MYTVKKLCLVEAKCGRRMVVEVDIGDTDIFWWDRNAKGKQTRREVPLLLYISISKLYLKLEAMGEKQ